MRTRSLYLGKLFTLILVVVLPGLISAQAHFQKLIGGEKYKVLGMQPTSDGGYIITGSKFIQPGIYDYSLIKTDSAGEPEWMKSYGYIYNDEPASVIQTADSGYAIIGFSDVSGGGAPSAYIVKTDASGDTLWTRTYGTTNLDYGTSIQEDENGEYIIGGYTWNTAGANFDPFIMKLKSNGDSLWSKIYRGPGDDKCQMVQKTSDNGYILVGATNSDGTGGYDYLLIKTDSMGTIQWSKTYGGAAMDIGFLVLENNNSGYLIAGWTKSFGAGTFEVYLVNVDMNGDQLWSKTYGGGSTDWPWSIQNSTDGGYIIVAETESFGAGGFDAYLIKTDSLGDTLWTKTYGGNQDDYLVNLDQISTDEYMFFGGTSSFGTFDESIYIVRTDGAGNSGCNEMNTQTVVTDPLTIADTVSLTTESGMGITLRITTVKVDSFLDSILCYTCNEPIALFEVLDSFLSVSFSDSSLNASSWTWDFGDGNTSTQQNPSHTYATEGSYSVCLTATNACGTDTICTNLNVTVGVEENTVQSKIKIYPNPTSGLIKIDILLANIYSVKLFHVNGQLILVKDISVVANTSMAQVDLREYPKGMYYLQVLTNTEVFIHKILLE